MRDVTVIIPQASGAVPELWAALGDAEINVAAAMSFSREHHRVVHAVVEDADAEEAKRVLSDAGYLIVDVREVLIVPLDNRPGALADVTQKAEDAGADVYLLSTAVGDSVLLGAVNLEAARAAFGL